jgi:hypothetical protein
VKVYKSGSTYRIKLDDPKSAAVRSGKGTREWTVVSVGDKFIKSVLHVDLCPESEVRVTGHRSKGYGPAEADLGAMYQTMCRPSLAWMPRPVVPVQADH